MPKRRKPFKERKPEDYMEAADNALELAKVLAGQGGISDQDFLEKMARSDELVDHDGEYMVTEKWTTDVLPRAQGSANWMV